MEKKRIKNLIISVLCIIGSVLITIAAHAVMPSPGGAINVENFNSVFVQRLGFPAVATIYFILLYLHVLIVVRYFGNKSKVNKVEIGLRYGVAFALMYFVGMQEVAIDASPFSSWGIGYISYQFFMGLGDAIPVIILSMIVACLTLTTNPKKSTYRKYSSVNNVFTVCTISIAFSIERVVGYLIGYVHSDIERFPIPVLLWTVIFGMVLGIAFIIIRPIYYEKSIKIMECFQIVIFTLGINWIWFNCFMGFILAGTIFQMLLRSGIDIMVLFIVVLILDMYASKKIILT